jgi:hypothetical protein
VGLGGLLDRHFVVFVVSWGWWTEICCDVGGLLDRNLLCLLSCGVAGQKCVVLAGLRDRHLLC